MKKSASKDIIEFKLVAELLIYNIRPEKGDYKTWWKGRNNYSKIYSINLLFLYY